MHDHWEDWQRNWRWMQAVARRRSMSITPLAIDPPATNARIAALEARHGMTVPTQLREVLSRFSAKVTFGWSVPSHLRPTEGDLPTLSANRDAVWDIAHIADHAIPNFLSWKQALAQEEISEVPNRPQMWENQFAFYALVNGDMLTIDTADPEPARQPVRYFSHELAMLHGCALAPDFQTYICVMSRLGHAGSEWASMMLFGTDEGDDRFTLAADGPGALRWLSWLNADPARRAGDTPPPVMVEQTAADRALLDAARAHSPDGVAAALAAGAQPDCVYTQDFRARNGLWDEEFFTAISYAVRHDDRALVDTLLSAGATLDTRHLPLNVAASEASAAMVLWLVDRGARVNRWKGQRYAPLHDLVRKRGPYAKHTLDSYLRQEEEDRGKHRKAEHPGAGDSNAESAEEVPNAEQAFAKKLADMRRSQLGALFARHIDHQAYLRLIEALLTAGADPDAIWDGTTMLCWCDAGAAKVLLRHGADANYRAANGWTPLHYAQDPEMVRVLAGHGGDVNDLGPVTEVCPAPYTPLQGALLGRNIAKVQTLIELGADPHKTDAAGFPTQAYCVSSETFEFLSTFGFDPRARMPDGGTLLHTLLRMRGALRASWPEEVAVLDHLLSFGIDINARDGLGKTMLHLACGKLESDLPDDIALLLSRGADPGIRDNDGKAALDYVPRKLRTVRAVLR